jgi:hypothetical protein
MRSPFLIPTCKWFKRSNTLRGDKILSFSTNWSSLISKRTLMLFCRRAVMLRVLGRFWCKKNTSNRSAWTNKVLHKPSRFRCHLKWASWTNRNNLSNIKTHHNLWEIHSCKIWAGRWINLKHLLKSQLCRASLLLPSKSSRNFYFN